MARILAQDSVNHIRMQVTACLKAFKIGPHWSEQWAFNIIAVFGEFKIG
jgi:hypothetical protein